MEKKYVELGAKKGIKEEVFYEFNVEEIAEENFFKIISEKIIEKLDRYRGMLEEFMQADGNSVGVLFEIKALDDMDKDKIQNIFKELMILKREFQLIDLQNTEEGFSTFVRGALQRWNKVKPQLMEIIDRAKDSWENDHKVKEELGYLG